MKVVYRKSPVNIPPPPRIEVLERDLVPCENHKPHAKKKKRFSQMIPAVFVTIGSVLIANIVWPIVSYQLFVSPALQPLTFVSPIAEDKTSLFAEATVPAANAAEAAGSVKSVAPMEPKTGSVAGTSPDVTPSGATQLQGESQTPEPKIINDELDYTNLSTWFPTQQIPEVRPEEAKTYTIDIPALGVEKATVKVGGLNLDKSLIQYPGTANPGELGSPVIFGHSVSPMFYNPSINNPRRYTSIFTKLMDLKTDDKIIVQFDGITYTYRVAGKVEVKPEDTYILEQRYDIRELKLITCTPAGTYLRRGVVYAVLEDIQK